MPPEGATAQLRSNSGEDVVKWTVFDYNDEIVAIDVEIERRSLEGDHEIQTSVEHVLRFTLPCVLCQRAAWRDLLSRLESWATLPIGMLASSDFRFDSELRATDYAFRDSFRITVGPTEISRHAGDHRSFRISWQRSSAAVSFTMVVDVTAMALFTTELKRKG